MNSIFKQIVYTIALLALAVSAVAAQATSKNRVAEFTNWSVFVENNPMICWSVSAPTKQENRQKGRLVQVKRSATQLMVSVVPSKGIGGQVGFTGGYPFESGSTVNLNIDGTAFQLTAGSEDNSLKHAEWAWPKNAEEDAKIIDALKRGNRAEIRGKSTRGTNTIDTFSLIGFTAALEEVRSKCKS
ncbi:MAG: hypothetical protein OXC62_13700 [Aestuariivita sp.]|nr:hypothetical protein [Aestuariivita sp.]